MSLYIILFILWLCFWSFSTVLISRWKSWKWWIMLWRSECPHCWHTLSALELVPVLSWVFQWWRCKECKTNIPVYYPLSEVLVWFVFVLMWVISTRLGFWILSPTTLVLLFWWFVTIVYIIYDLRYMEIPDQILIPGIIITLLLLWIWWISQEYQFFFSYEYYNSFHTFLTNHTLAAIYIYSFFFLQILIPGSIYLVKAKRPQELVWLFASYFTFPIVILIDFFKPRNNDTEDSEIPTWIWGWDLRIAIFIWLTLWITHSISTLFFAYVLWSIVWICLLIHWKIVNKKVSSMIPFWPFLGIGWFLSLIFYTDIIKYLEFIIL